MKLSPLHFQLSIIVIEKRLPDLASPRVDNSPTRRVGEYDSFWLFLRPSIIALYRKSIDKSSKDINVGESVSMNVAPLNF